jgi:hypothetical protein
MNERPVLTKRWVGADVAFWVSAATTAMTKVDQLLPSAGHISLPITNVSPKEQVRLDAEGEDKLPS